MIDDLLSLAGEAVSHARKLGADAVHAVAADGRSTEISILDGKIEKVEQSEARDISLKVYAGKSSASISGSVLTKEAIHRLAENALNMARLAPPDPWSGVADPDQLANDIPDLDLAADDLPAPKALEELPLRAEAAGLAVPGVTKSVRGRRIAVGNLRRHRHLQRLLARLPAHRHGPLHVGHRGRRASACSGTMTIPPLRILPTCAILKPSAAAQESAR